MCYVRKDFGYFWHFLSLNNDNNKDSIFCCLFKKNEPLLLASTQLNINDHFDDMERVTSFAICIKIVYTFSYGSIHYL